MRYDCLKKKKTYESNKNIKYFISCDLFSLELTTKAKQTCRTSTTVVKTAYKINRRNSVQGLEV